MSVRAYNERRKAYRQKANQVSNPGQPSPTNRKARRAAKRRKTVGTIGHRPPVGALLAAMAMLAVEAGADAERLAPLMDDPDPPLKCDCGQCLPGQDRECPARAIARAEYLMEDR